MSDQPISGAPLHAASDAAAGSPPATVSPRWINRGAPAGWLDIAVVERMKNARYLGDFCLRTRSGGWTTEAAAVFWQDTPPEPHYSSYFGLFRWFDALQMVSADSVADGVWEGMVADDGEVIYSRYRHDFRWSSDQSVAVDGGRDYFKVLGKITNPRVRLHFEGEHLVLDNAIVLPFEPPA